jgi:hypothetical protein
MRYHLANVPATIKRQAANSLHKLAARGSPALISQQPRSAAA